MSTEGRLLFDEHYARIQQMIDAALRGYKPNLNLAVGGLSPTRYPTPTGNAPGGYTPSAHTHPWSDITSTPTTLSGYGITDAQPLDSDLTAIAALSTTSYGRGFLPLADAAAVRTYIGVTAGGGTVTSVGLTAPAEFGVGGSPVTTSGTLALTWTNVAHSLVLAGPASVIASPAAPTFRQLVQKDMPVNSAFVDTDNAFSTGQTFTDIHATGNATIDGTLTLANKSANTVFAGPTSGGAATPAFRALATGDIPNLPSSIITSGEIPRSPLTTRGDVLTQNPSGTHTRLAIGASGRYLRSDGTDPSWHTLDAADLTYSGLTAGQVLRATGASAAAFGAVDLADTDAVTGLLSPINGGTGVNNSTRTLTVATNGGTLAFSAASSTLTIPATGTAALLGTAQTFSENNTFGKIVRAPVTSGTTGYGIRIWDGTTDYGNWQALDLGGASYLFFATNRQYDGTAWQQLNTRPAGLVQISADDTLIYYTFPASSSTPTERFRVQSDGNVGLFGGSSFGSGAKVAFVANRTTAPTANPTGGGLLYAASGAGTWRGSSGSVTAFGAAGPHCARCGYDAWRVAMRNPSWGAYLYECGWCGAVYRQGPPSVLHLLEAEQQREIIRQGMSYAALERMLA